MASNQKRSFYEKNGVSFDVPREVIAEFETGLENLEHAGDGLEQETIREAKEIVRTGKVTVAKILKMIRFWARNRRFLKGKDKSPMWTSSKLWGGNPGRKWAEKVLAQMKRANPKLESVMLGMMKKSLELTENLIYQDGVDPDGLSVLEYAGFSGDGGLVFQAAAEAAMLAGDKGGKVVVEVPSTSSFIDKMGLVESFEFAMNFKGFHRLFMKRLSDTIAKADSKAKGRHKRVFREVMDASIDVGKSFDAAIEGKPGAVTKLINKFGILSSIRFDLSALEGDMIRRDMVLRDAKVRKFEESILRMFAGLDRPKLSIDRDLLDIDEMFNTMVLSFVEEVVEVMFKELDIRSKVEVVEGRGDHIAISGPEGETELDYIKAFEDIEFFFRVPSGAPRKLGQGTEMYSRPIKVLRSSDHDIKAAQLRASKKKALVGAERKAQRSAGVKNTAVAKARSTADLAGYLKLARR